jgi:palmitoyltransferase ZDHHC2/15/20
MSSETIDYKLAYYIITSYILGTSLAVVITAFFSFHIWLILNQYTTIEFCEKKREDDNTFKISPYNIGRFNNLKTVLGNNVLLWLFPFCKYFILCFILFILGPNSKGEGLMFEVR